MNNDESSALEPRSQLSEYLDEVAKVQRANNKDNDLPILDQLDQLWAFLNEKYPNERKVHFLSSHLMKRYASIYTQTLNDMMLNGNQSFNIKLIDITNKLNDILTLNLKKLSMKSNWETSLKHFSVIIFQSLFDKFDGFLNVYKIQILTSIYKHLSKVNDNINQSIENGLFNANYVNNLTILANIIISHDIKPILDDDKLYTRTIKMVKFLTARTSSFVFPVITVSNAFTIMTYLYKSDKFVHSLVSKNSRFNCNTYLNSIQPQTNAMILSFESDKALRFSLSKNLSDLLVFTFLNFSNDEDNNLEVCLNFLFFEYRKENQPKSIKVGLIEATNQFLSTLNLYYKANHNCNFISLNFFKILNILLFNFFDFGIDINLKLIKSKLKESKFITLTNSNSSNDSIKTLNHINLIFKLIIKEIDNDINKLIILNKLMFSDESNDGTKILPLDKLIHSPTHQIENIWYSISILELIDYLIGDLGEFILTTTKDLEEDYANKFVNKLLEFCLNKNFQIRILSVDLIIKILKIKPDLSSSIVKSQLALLVESFNGLESDIKSSGSFNANHGTSLLISSIFSFASNEEYISNDLILSSFSLAFNFLKKFNSNLISNNLFSNDSTLISNIDYERQLISWISLMGIFNFNKFSDSPLVQDSNQFLNIWKNLLNLNFVINNKINITEILKLLEVKNYSLICLSCYISYLISNDKLSNDLTKSINQILLLSFTSLSNLVNQLSDISSNATLKLSININKLRIYQNYLKLVPYLNVKNEINSNMLIEIVKNFSDINQFQPTNFKRKSHLDIYQYDDQFGLSSKLNGFKVDELLFKLKPVNNNETVKKIMESPNDITDFFYNFDSQLDNTNYNYFNYSKLNDPLLKLSNGNISLGYTTHSDVCPDYHTMIIDTSIEIFTFTFPYLSTKIQQSILETIRSDLFYQIKESVVTNNEEEREALEIKNKSIEIRRQCININSSVAFNSLLSYMININSELSPETFNLIIETLKNMDITNAIVRTINCRNIGMANKVSKDDDTSLQISSFINSIINNPSDVNLRAFVILSIGYLTQNYSSPEIENSIFTLTLDPNPLIHSSSLLSLRKMIEKHLNFHMINRIVDILSNILVSDTFGFDSPMIITNDLNIQGYLNSNVLISKIINDIINQTGPMISTWDQDLKDKITLLMSWNLKLTNICNYEINVMENLKFMNSVSMFDKSMLNLNEYLYLIEHCIKDNIFIGVNTINRFNNIDFSSELFPMTTSSQNLQMGIDSIYQFVKLNQSQINDSFKLLIWIVLEKLPQNESIKEVLKIFTFDQLNSSYNDKLNVMDKLIKGFFIDKTQLDKPLYNEFKTRINTNWFTKINLIKPSPVAKPKSKKKGEDEENETRSKPTTIKDDGFNKILNLNEEQTSWVFKTFMIKLINMSIDKCFLDEDLRKIALNRLDDLVKICFISSTNNVKSLRIESLKLLNKIWDLFHNEMDPIFPTKSILDQQNAQIISTIIPTFNKNSNLEIVSEGLLISSKLIAKDGTNMTRLINILTQSLENLAILNKLGITLDEEEYQGIKIGKLELNSSKSIAKVKIKILQSWSNIVINGKESELIDQYIDVLIPLLIDSIKENVVEKYQSQINVFDEECKIVLIQSLTILIEKYYAKFDQLLGDDTGKIFIIIFSEIVEYFIKMIGKPSKDDDLKMLQSFKRLLTIDFAMDIIFNESIYIELVDLFNKLILINDGDILIEISSILKDIFVKFMIQSGLDEEKVEKLFELLRLQFKIVTKKLPFIKTRDIANCDVDLNGKDLIILRKTFISIIEMNDKLPEDIQKDILIDLTFMLILIHQLGNEELISIMLPIYQMVFNKYRDLGEDDNLNNILTILKLNYEEVNDQLLTFIMIKSIPNLKINDEQLNLIIDIIFRGLTKKDEVIEDDNLFPITIKTCKSLIIDHSNISQKLLPSLINKLVKEYEELREPKLIIELIMGLIKRSPDKILKIYQLIIQLVISFFDCFPQEKGYLQNKLLELVQFNHDDFKMVLNQLGTEQQSCVENILKSSLTNEHNNQSHIELKQFI